MVSQCTKFEISRFTRYEAMNGSAKCRKWGGQGALKVIGNVTVRYSAYDFLFDFNRNYVSYLLPFSRYSRLLVKSRHFDPPHLHSAPSQGVTPVEFRGDLQHQKTRVPGGIVWCCLCDPTFSCFSRAPTCDGRTDRDGHRAMASTAYAQHRAVKTNLISV